MPFVGNVTVNRVDHTSGFFPVEVPAGPDTQIAPRFRCLGMSKATVIVKQLDGVVASSVNLYGVIGALTSFAVVDPKAGQAGLIPLGTFPIGAIGVPTTINLPYSIGGFRLLLAEISSPGANVAATNYTVTFLCSRF